MCVCVCVCVSVAAVGHGVDIIDKHIFRVCPASKETFGVLKVTNVFRTQRTDALFHTPEGDFALGAEGILRKT